MVALVRKIFGSRNERVLKHLRRTVKKINALESEFDVLSDEQLHAKTDEFRQRLAGGEPLNHLLPEAFAVVREASKRTLGMRHFDVQMIGGLVLHSGKIAEMRTGEGKTLVATLALYLNALSGKGAHLITVNDYLAKRDAEQMGKIYEFLGLTVGVILANMDPDARRQAYACDITYGTNNEFGFDYLRDNMAFSLEEQVQRGLHFAVVDEVDSILIDEARTPLIISGPAEDSAGAYQELNAIIPQLTRREGEDGPGDYYLDEKNKQAYLTEEGHEHIEQLLANAGLIKAGDSLYSAANVTLMHYVNASLRAQTLYEKDVDYMVSSGEIVIVDEHTGRAMAGRRWSDGLHQAMEAKEGLEIKGENQTMASITFQNYFRMYDKLSGMTGTADTEAFELHQIYALEVVVIPTNKPMIRKDHADLVYLTAQEKYDAVVEEIKQRQVQKQPVLVGTASIEASEYLSSLLKKAQVKHEVLNAKQHEREAGIILNAGLPGAVTIATNMAGRGTDIVLGGNWQAEIDALDNPNEQQIAAIKQSWKQRHDEVLTSGGLHIVGSERHESRRIDNQLRGRAGRQGDPGSSRFFLSLDDNLIRIFVSDRMRTILGKVGMGKGEALESRMVTKNIAGAQKKVENHNFDIRKQLLEYDNVANDQRRVIYAQRQDLLAGTDVAEIIEDMREDVVSSMIAMHIPPGSLVEQWDIAGLENALQGDFDIKLALSVWLDQDEMMDEKDLQQRILTAVISTYDQKKKLADPTLLKQFEKAVLLQSLDNHWREHLSNLDHLRHSINLRGYAQKDPKQEYKRESFELFSDMLDKFRYDVISTISKVQVEAPEDVAAVENQWQQSMSGMTYQHINADKLVQGNTQQPLELERKVGRNEPCPCGSGKKFKQCHGKIS